VLGAGFGCARLTDRTTWCWGDNGHGQVATDRERERSLVPMQIPVSGSVALGRPGQTEGGHVCALLDYGQVSCWGRNDQGQLGRGTVGEPGAPARVDWPR
jgi:alpha-tubulin suppressor-like RCC1 family protein